MDQTDNTTYPEGIEVFEILVSRDATTEKKKLPLLLFVDRRITRYLGVYEEGETLTSKSGSEWTGSLQESTRGDESGQPAISMIDLPACIWRLV